MIVIGKLPALVVVPASVAVPFPLSMNMIPLGRLPVSLKAGVGVPVDITVNMPAMPAVNVVLAPLVICGGVPVTVKAPVRLAVPPPGAGFVTETVCPVSEAVEEIVILAVIWVPLFTVTLFTVMSGPKLTVVTPLRKLVPVKTTFRV